MAFESINPTNGQIIATYKEMPQRQLDDALNRCHEAQYAWKKTDFKERSRCLHSLSEILLKGKEDLALLMSQEMGKILSQGIAEIEKCALVCRFYADHGKAFLTPEPVETEAYRSFVNFQPMGIILTIMPWNFPFWQVMRTATAALMAGNGVLLKHAPNVCGCSLEIEKLFFKAGFPEHLFRSLLIDIPATTATIHDPRVAAVSITSSVLAGRQVAAEAGRALKKCVLELGGSDPFIILGDADLDQAVKTGITSRFQNNGQSCIAAKRFIIVDERYDQFEAHFVEATTQLRMGSPLEDTTQIGPLARTDLRDKLAAQVRQSVLAGARILTGGEIPPGPGAFYTPTVLAGVHEGMPAWSEELFGPVAALIRVRNEAEAIQVANTTEFGLSCSVWTRDLARGQRIAIEAIESGSAFVNCLSRSDVRMPFGGIRHSGYGRELSIYGIREFVNTHAVWIENPTNTNN